MNATELYQNGQAQVDGVKVIVDEIDPNNIYVGESTTLSATTDAERRIKKISISGTTTTISYADGVRSEFTKVWDDRATYSY